VFLPPSHPAASEALVDPAPTSCCLILTLQPPSFPSPSFSIAQLNITLQELVLRSNRIGDLGAAALGGVVRASAALTVLDIGGNWLPTAPVLPARTATPSASLPVWRAWREEQRSGTRSEH